jgi:HAD superfamily hydrolase (TIGR01509 family)
MAIPLPLLLSIPKGVSGPTGEPDQAMDNKPSKLKKLKVEAVIFDLDGTLIDSIGIYFMIVENALERLNLPTVSRASIQAAAEDENFNWGLVLPDELMNRKTEIIDRAREITNKIAPPLFEKNVKLIPGADLVLKSISSNGLKIGLVTSTRRSFLKIKMRPLKSAGVADLFEAIISSDDTQKRKPAPEPLLACARQLRVEPDKCAYVGDTRTDMRAGQAAAMKTIGVLTGFDELKLLQKETPDAVIDSIGNLMEVIEF